jgi:hypothetical protein
MADPNILAQILAGNDPLSPQIAQGLQGAQLSSDTINSPPAHGPFGVLAKYLGASQGHDMLNNAVQQTTQARLGAQPDMARLMASPNAYQDLATKPQDFNPIARSAFLSGGPEQAQKYQLGQQLTTEAALKNAAGIAALRAQAAALGFPMPTTQDVRSGNYQGPDYTRMFSGTPGGQGSGAPAAGGGPISDPRGLVPYIRLSAVQNNIDPDVAVRVASSEGLAAPAGASGDGGTSGNAFQLHVTPGGKGSAVGDLFREQTGLDPLDPANEKATIDFALHHAAKNGWGAWTGAAKAGIAPFQGITPAGRPMQVAQAGGGTATDASVGGPSLAGGAPPSAAMSPAEAFRMRAQLQALGMPIPQAANDYLAAQMMPPGPARDLALAQAMKSGGLDAIQNIRANGTLLGLDPNHPLGPPKVLYHAPSLAGGQTVSQPVPGGPLSAVDVPGAMQGFETEEASKARGGGQYKPETYYDKFGNPVQGTAAQAPQFANPAPSGAPPQAAPAGPPGTLSVGGAIPSGMPAPPPLAPKQSPYGAAPTFLANTPTGQKDISQVHVNDMFPGGAGIPQPGGPAGPPTELQKEIQKTDADRLSGYNKEQGANQQINQDLLRLHGVLERGFSTSNVARIGADLANTAHGLGADWAYPAGWAPASAAEFDKASTDLVFAALKTLPGQPRVTEITGLQKANPNIVIPRETNYQMMNDILARSKWQDERARLATEFTVEHKGVPLSLFDSAYNRMAPLPDVANEYMGVLRQHGAVFPEDVKAGGGPAAPPARRSRFNPATGKIEPM